MLSDPCTFVSCAYFHHLLRRLLRRLLLKIALAAAPAAILAAKGSKTGLASSFIRSLATLEAKVENKRKGEIEYSDKQYLV